MTKLKDVQRIFIKISFKNLKVQLKAWNLNFNGLNNVEPSLFEAAFLRIFFTAGARMKLSNGSYV